VGLAVDARVDGVDVTLCGSGRDRIRKAKRRE
jgi:hypothetical protein